MKKIISVVIVFLITLTLSVNCLALGSPSVVVPKITFETVAASNNVKINGFSEVKPGNATKQLEQKEGIVNLINNFLPGTTVVDVEVLQLVDIDAIITDGGVARIEYNVGKIDLKPGYMLQVIHYSGDVWEAIPTEYIDNKVVFTVSGFSPFAITLIKTEESGDEAINTSTENEPKSPKTGAVNELVFIVIVMGIISALGIKTVIYNKKNG